MNILRELADHSSSSTSIPSIHRIQKFRLQRSQSEQTRIIEPPIWQFILNFSRIFRTRLQHRFISILGVTGLSWMREWLLIQHDQLATSKMLVCSHRDVWSRGYKTDELSIFLAFVDDAPEPQWFTQENTIQKGKYCINGNDARENHSPTERPQPGDGIEQQSSNWWTWNDPAGATDPFAGPKGTEPQAPPGTTGLVDAALEEDLANQPRDGSQSVNSDGARAMLDQLPTITPKARAIANQ